MALHHPWAALRAYTFTDPKPGTGATGIRCTEEDCTWHIPDLRTAPHRTLGSIELWVEHCLAENGPCSACARLRLRRPAVEEREGTRLCQTHARAYDALARRISA